jgi:hypothetical protein
LILKLNNYKFDEIMEKFELMISFTLPT